MLYTTLVIVTIMVYFSTSPSFSFYKNSFFCWKIDMWRKDRRFYTWNANFRVMMTSLTRRRSNFEPYTRYWQTYKLNKDKNKAMYKCVPDGPLRVNSHENIYWKTTIQVYQTKNPHFSIFYELHIPLQIPLKLPLHSLLSLCTSVAAS